MDVDYAPVSVYDRYVYSEIYSNHQTLIQSLVKTKEGRTKHQGSAPCSRFHIWPAIEERNKVSLWIKLTRIAPPKALTK